MGPGRGPLPSFGTLPESALKPVYAHHPSNHRASITAHVSPALNFSLCRSDMALPSCAAVTRISARLASASCSGAVFTYVKSGAVAPTVFTTPAVQQKRRYEMERQKKRGNEKKEEGQNLQRAGR
jgi:hypothetical protein